MNDAGVLTDNITGLLAPLFTCFYVFIEQREGNMLVAHVFRSFNYIYLAQATFNSSKL